jgi:hypothetical protein
MNVDMKESAMFWSRSAIRDEAVRVCHRCGEVCNRICEADALKRRALDQVLRQGWRLA